MTALLGKFPFMARKLAYWPTDVKADQIVANAYAGASRGEKMAIEFLLHVWDPNMDWTTFGYQNFNLGMALGTWSFPSDASIAVAAWVGKPFFP